MIDVRSIIVDLLNKKFGVIKSLVEDHDTLRDFGIGGFNIIDLAVAVDEAIAEHPDFGQKIDVGNEWCANTTVKQMVHDVEKALTDLVKKLSDEELKEYSDAVEALETTDWEFGGAYVRGKQEGSSCSVCFDIEREEEGEFIALARRAVPRLLAEVQRLKDIIDENR